MSILKKYGYAWITVVLFLGSLGGHWTFSWFAYVNEARAHAQPVLFPEFLVEVLRDTLENWQSEFLQLLWQVAGLAYFWYLGSPQSKEGEERKEEKIDEILRLLDGEKAQAIIADLEKKYPKG